MLGDVLNELGSSLSVDETLSLLAARLKHMIPYDTVAIYVRKEQRLVPQFVNGEEYRLFSSLDIPMGHGLSGWVAENRRPIINGNPSVEPGYLNDPTKFSRMRSALSVPLEGLGGVAGVLTLYQAEPDAFTRDHLRILQAISSKAGLALENALKFRQVENSAVTDELTGLPNARSLFIQLDSELARAKRTGATLVVLVLDLDGFKSINDRFGHLAGNKVLQMISEGLRSSCREYDCVARMGGDEFVVILGGSTRDPAESRARTDPLPARPDRSHQRHGRGIIRPPGGKAAGRGARCRAFARRGAALVQPGGARADPAIPEGVVPLARFQAGRLSGHRPLGSGPRRLSRPRGAGHRSGLAR
jgi:GGDEF domain-containing protein